MKEQNNGALAGKATSADQGSASSKAQEWRVVDNACQANRSLPGLPYWRRQS
jgi:hypothetical protein